MEDAERMPGINKQGSNPRHVHGDSGQDRHRERAIAAALKTEKGGLRSANQLPGEENISHEDSLEYSRD
jgi:hypothetical protein